MIRRVGAELFDRALAPRQRLRVGAAAALAAEIIQDRLSAGDEPRTDGFFSEHQAGERPDADELLEGVLTVSRDTFEEKKLRHLASLFANVCFAPSVSPAAANFYLYLADRMTYRQLVVLAICERKGETTLDDPEELKLPVIPEVMDLPYRKLLPRIEVFDLMQWGLIVRPSGLVEPLHINGSRIEATPMGGLLFALMGLADVPTETLQPFAEDLRFLPSGLHRPYERSYDRESSGQ